MLRFRLDLSRAHSLLFVLPRLHNIVLVLGVLSFEIILILITRFWQFCNLTLIGEHRLRDYSEVICPFG